MSDSNHAWVLQCWETDEGRLVDEIDTPQVFADRQALDTQLLSIIKRDAQNIPISGPDSDPGVRERLRCRAEMREYVRIKDVEKAWSAWLGYQLTQRKQKHMAFSRVPILGVVDIKVH